MATEKLQGSTSNRAVFTILDSEALPWPSLTHAAAGLELWATPEGGTPVAITPSSGNFVEKKNGQYHVLVPDSLYTGTARISFSGAITDGTVHGEIHTIRVAAVATQASVQTLLDRITGLLRTKAEDDAADTAIVTAIGEIGDAPATETIAAAVLAAAVISPIRANLKLINDAELVPTTDYAKEATLQAFIAKFTNPIFAMFGYLVSMITPPAGEVGPQFTEEALANAGGGGGGGGSGGTGTIRVPFKFVKPDATAIANVKVSIPGTGAINYSGTDGTTFLMVDPSATYTVRVSPPSGYETVDDFQVEVGTSDPDETEIELTAFAGTPIGPEGTCTLSFRVASQSDTNLESVIASAKLVGPTGPRSWIARNLTLNLNVVESAPSDASGNVAIALLPDQDYDLSVQRPGHTPAKIRIRTPNSPTATLPQVIEV